MLTAKRGTLLFIGERATPYSASCSQGNVIMDAGWLSSQEQHWTGPLFDNKCAAFMTFSQATDTLHSCNFTHQKAQSLLDDSHLDYGIIIIIKKQKQYIANVQKRACVLAEAAQRWAHWWLDEPHQLQSTGKLSHLRSSTCLTCAGLVWVCSLLFVLFCLVFFFHFCFFLCAQRAFWESCHFLSRVAHVKKNVIPVRG